MLVLSLLFFLGGDKDALLLFFCGMGRILCLWHLRSSILLSLDPSGPSTVSARPKDGTVVKRVFLDAMHSSGLAQFYSRQLPSKRRYSPFKKKNEDTVFFLKEL